MRHILRLLILKQSWEWYATLFIEIFKEATSVNTKEQSVTLNSGKTLKYDSLVIATGGDVRWFSKRHSSLIASRFSVAWQGIRQYFHHSIG